MLSPNLMYGNMLNAVIGFHGCSRSTFESIIYRRQMLHKSTNSYDWHCKVIEHLHLSRKLNNEIPFDTVRGAFWEGEPLYYSSGFCKQNHIQICVRNPNCIKGFFEPRDYIDDWQKWFDS